MIAPTDLTRKVKNCKQPHAVMKVTFLRSKIVLQTHSKYS